MSESLKISELSFANPEITSYLDFSKVPSQDEYSVIPANTIVSVNMTITPGGHNDPARGWTGGWATRNPVTNSCYLKVKFKILDGEFKGRQILSLIGLHSDKGPEYAAMGQSFMKTILDSKNGISSKDNSENADKLRVLKSLGDLNNINFVAKVSVGQDQHGNPKNEIKYAVTIDNPSYTKVDQPLTKDVLVDDELPFDPF